MERNLEDMDGTLLDTKKLPDMERSLEDMERNLEDMDGNLEDINK